MRTLPWGMLGILMAMLAAGAEQPPRTASGFVVGADGLIVTCAHVAQDALRLRVSVGGDVYDGVLLGLDTRHDLALLHVPAKGLTPLPLANSNVVEPNLRVHGYGYPIDGMLDQDLTTLRSTVVELVTRDTQRLFQIASGISAGSSGGPVVDEAGAVIGVLDAALTGTGDQVNLVVPVNHVKPLLRDQGVEPTVPAPARPFEPIPLGQRVAPSVAHIAWWPKESATPATPPPSQPQPQPLPEPQPQAQPAANVRINPTDQAEMVCIPAGEFTIGSAAGDGNRDEHPQRRIQLSAYCIYRHEVTVSQWRKFCEATGRQMPPAPIWGWQDDHPIVNVSWVEASAYAQWAGVMLPTEAQWERAARGTDERTYPWGNDWDPTRCINAANAGHQARPVGSIPADVSPSGALDMAGNVWEWCRDLYDMTFYETMPARDPVAARTSFTRVVRGGSWFDSEAEIMRVPRRYNVSPDQRLPYIGFRCVAVE